MEFSAYCGPPYYVSNDKCTKYCLDRDDQYGHYTCDEEGNIWCRQGRFAIDSHPIRINMSAYHYT